MRKKLFALLLAAVMVMLSLSGCSKPVTDPTESDADQTTLSSETEEAKNFNEEGYPIVNEEITLKVLLCVRDADSLIKPEDMPAVKRLDELTGIKTEWEVVKSSDFSTKINLIFTTGDYPDVILGLQQGNLDVEEYGVSQKILIPLDELIDKYMPIYSGRIADEDTDPTISLIASDGQKYNVGFLLGPTYATDWFHCINQEWLDALNLDTPTDVESLTEVLRAFKTQDPNGNGEADEIPIVANMVLNDGYGVQNMLPLFGIPATTGGKWLYIDDNKSVQLIPAREEFRECLEWLHMCYDEDLLDPEVISQDGNVVASKLTEGVAGLYTAWSIGTMGFDESCVLWVPDSDTASICTNLTIAKPSAAVTCTNENVEATMRWLDAMLEKEMMWSLYYGEKDDYDYGGWIYDETGKVKLLSTSEEMKNEPFQDLNVNAMLFMPKTFYDQYVTKAEMRVERENYCDAYTEAGVFQKYSNAYFNLVSLTTEQAQENTLLETDLNNAVKEFIAESIMEGVTDAKWSAFVAELEKMGTAEYVAMYQSGIDALNIQ